MANFHFKILAKSGGGRELMKIRVIVAGAALCAIKTHPIPSHPNPPQPTHTYTPHSPPPYLSRCVCERKSKEPKKKKSPRFIQVFTSP